MHIRLPGFHSHDNVGEDRAAEIIEYHETHPFFARPTDRDTENQVAEQFG